MQTTTTQSDSVMRYQINRKVTFCPYFLLLKYVIIRPRNYGWHEQVNTSNWCCVMTFLYSFNRHDERHVHTEMLVEASSNTSQLRPEATPKPKCKALVRLREVRTWRHFPWVAPWNHLEIDVTSSAQCYQHCRRREASYEPRPNYADVIKRTLVHHGSEKPDAKITRHNGHMHKHQDVYVMCECCRLYFTYSLTRRFFDTLAVRCRRHFVCVNCPRRRVTASAMKCSPSVLSRPVL